MGVVADLVAGVTVDSELDVTEPQVLRWLTERQREMCAQVGWYRKTLDLGAVVAGQAGYAVPAEVIEILQVTVGGLVYADSRHADSARSERGFLLIVGEGGLAGRDDSAAGEQLLRLVPTPAAGSEPTPGEAHVSVYATVQTPTITAGADSTVVVPADYYSALTAGAIATGMLRDEATAAGAAPQEQIFQTAIVRLRRATNRRFQGSGPSRVRIVGVNA